MAEPRPEDASPGFDSLGLDPRLVEALATLGYEEPTPIQRATIPSLIEGRDLVGQAATGTGKTAAFALPLLHRLSLMGDDRPRPTNLVLVPTRELAMQVAQAVHRYGKALGIDVLAIYGGQAYGPQLRALDRGVDVVVATPGRALDHIKRRTMPLEGVATVVLDEADEMLDMGFADDIEAILSATPDQRQTVLFSATMPPRIAAIAKRHLRDPVQITIAKEKLPAGAVPKVRQVAYVVPRAYKIAALGRVLDLENPTSAIIFCRRRDEVDQLAETLNSRGYRAEALHGGMSQEQRDRVMKKFRGGNADLLIATDVAARGLDIEHLSHVVNYDPPTEVESYVHRIGRVGRAGREGVAITLTEPREHRLLQNFERVTKRKIELAQVPTVADVRSRRLDLTQAAVRETLIGGDLDRFRVVVESLTGEFDIMAVTLAAVKLAHDALGNDGEDEQEIPKIAPRAERPTRERERRPARGPKGDGPARDRPPRKDVAPTAGFGGGVARLFIGAGREAGVRPGDLVGAIANEAGISGKMIGAIEIADRFSFVEVPEDVAQEVVAALRASTIKGRKVTVRPAD
ncbi:DEAD/DEAH box helicase [Tautonia plasticadhaerens]|uniref:DEAD-box ATP-dependent RNA helicase RhpA n=1 Tax=Tautonia plasticadhaerens TaxID=2527974 RepID=A0A518H8M0_9BACT|nr:DEAD/DEAH box helicase [Tautonia plasticadhaerens]QDV37116.1 ATP-dependent RNA helicase DeaD [Tautonia plasticadhaerens]